MEELLKVDYDLVAGAYDGRFGATSFAKPPAALRDLADSIAARAILDLGCGTGHSLAWAGAESPLRVGLDLSLSMLRHAQALDASLALVRASAPYPPFQSGIFDLVFTHLAFHHFPEKQRVADEAYRLLQPRGVFAILTDDPRRSNWYLYDYFKGALEIDLARCPAISDIENMLERAGFIDVRSPLVQDLDVVEDGAAVLDSYFLRKDSTSTLILLAKDEYQEGLAKIRSDIDAANNRDDAIHFRTRIGTFMIHGSKPG